MREFCHSLIPVVVALWVAGSVSDAAGVAMLSEARGSVQVLQGGKTSWARGSLMMLLSQGDKVKTGDGSSATVVFFSSGTREQLTAGCMAQVEATNCKVVEGPAKKSLPPLKSATSTKLASSRLGSGRSGGVLLRGDEENQLVLLSLYDTKTRLSRPVFRWAPMAGCEEYVVRVMDREDKALWEGRTKTCELTYPDTAPALQAETDYTWEVQALREGKKRAAAFGEFSVLAKGDCADVEGAIDELNQSAVGTDDPTILLLKATILADHELWDEVLDCCARLTTAFPDDPSLHLHLANLLAQQGRAKESQEHSDKAKSLAEPK